jgi:hypothetical protein
MSTNYFNPITYLPRQPTQTPVQMPNQTSFTLPTNPGWGNVTGWSPNGPVAAPNQGQIQTLLAGLYGSGTPGQPDYVPGLNERVANQLGLARNNVRDRLRGYGGVSFRQDDPSTPNVDESLMMDYNPDQLGRNERQAVLGARAAANARGMLSSGFGDQLIGSALQRVGEDARAIVNQYSTQIKEISDRNFDPITGLANTTLNQIQSLYGPDAQWAANQELLRPPPPAAPAPPTPPPSSQPATNPGAVQAGESMVWRGTRPPNLATLQARHPNHTLRVVFVQGGGSDGAHYRVIAVPK